MTSSSLIAKLTSCCGLALLLLATYTLSPPTAAALDDPSSLIGHLRAELRSEDPTRQEDALMDATALAKCEGTCTIRLASVPGGTLRLENDTGLSTTVGIDELIPDLLTAYRRGPTAGHRQLALAALINTGNEDALEQLIEAKEHQGWVVRNATDHALAGYYLDQYPELIERSVRQRTLSLRDVREAAEQRERTAPVHARANAPE
jgi:hypothetical protein